MSTLRKIAEIPAGSWTKWLVVGFWVAVLAVACPLAVKLKHAEKNDTSQWVPAGAESTKVLDALARFQSPNISTAIVVYDRASSVTAADRAKAAADARRFAAIHDAVPRTVMGPILSADGKVMQTLVSVNLGKQGNAGDAATAIRAITGAGANGLSSHVTGPLGYEADNNNVFNGIDSSLLYAALAVVIVILLITYRSLVLWLMPVITSLAALFTAMAVIYLFAAHAGLTVS